MTKVRHLGKNWILSFWWLFNSFKKTAGKILIFHAGSQGKWKSEFRLNLVENFIENGDQSNLRMISPLRIFFSGVIQVVLFYVLQLCWFIPRFVFLDTSALEPIFPCRCNQAVLSNVIILKVKTKLTSCCQDGDILSS